MFLATNFDDGSAVIVASAVAVEEKLLNFCLFWIFILIGAFSCCAIWCSAILVCPSLKAVDVFGNKLWRRRCGYCCICCCGWGKIAQFLFVLNFYFDWCLFMLCHLMQCHFSMPFSESCWCFWQQTLTTAVRLLLHLLLRLRKNCSTFQRLFHWELLMGCYSWFYN